MNNAEVLCHSSGPWKKHKYFQKIGEGANAVYRYSKQKVKEAADKSGLSTKAEIEKNKDWAKMDNYNSSEDYIGENRKRYYSEQAKGERRTAYELQKKYNKTPLGKAESTAEKAKAIAKEKVDRGQKLIDKLLHPETKVTVETKTFSGKGSKSKKVKTNPDGSKVTIETTTYPRKKK